MLEPMAAARDSYIDVFEIRMTVDQEVVVRASST
jgi:hypothetical protein